MPTKTVTGFYTLDERLQRVRGWVLDPADPSDSQWVEILADNKVLAVVHANLDRSDLARLETGYTCYGFDFLFPIGTGDTAGTINVEVRHKASGTYLPSESKAFQAQRVSQTTLPVKDIDHLREHQVFAAGTRVAINSKHWYGNPEFRDQLIGFNGKTALRVGQMRAREDGCWEYTKNVRYYRISDAMVIMPFGIVIADGCLIRGNLGFPHPRQVGPFLSRATDDNEDDWLKTATEVRLRVVENEVHCVDSPTLLLSAPKYQGYNHWHVDVLPMLAETSHPSLSHINHAIGPGCPTGWHFDSLNLATTLYPDLEIVEYGEPGILRVKELIYTTGLAGNGCYLSPKLVAFYEQLGSLVDDEKAVPGIGNKLYLSRRAYPRRKLRNEAAIEQAVESLGFQVIDPAAHSYEEQVCLFRQADFIVSPHGAALTNLLYCRPGVKVVELFPDCYINLGLQRLANLKEARYGYMVGTSSGGPGGAGNHDFSYSIDSVALLRLIEEMGG